MQSSGDQYSISSMHLICLHGSSQALHQVYLRLGREDIWRQQFTAYAQNKKGLKHLHSSLQFGQLSDVAYRREFLDQQMQACGLPPMSAPPTQYSAPGTWV